MVCAAASDLFTMTLPEPARPSAGRLFLRGGDFDGPRMACCRATCRLGARRSRHDIHAFSRWAGLAAETPSCSPPPVFGLDLQPFPPIAFTSRLIGCGPHAPCLALAWAAASRATVLPKLAGAAAQSQERAYLTASRWPRPDCSSIPPHLLWPRSGAESLSKLRPCSPAERNEPAPRYLPLTPANLARPLTWR